MAADPLVGRVLDGRYRIVRKLAAGGMGRVYLAEQTGLDRTVALKVLAKEAKGEDTRFRERFFREAKLCSKLTHPNTVRIYDYGQTDDGVFYIAMEYLDGVTLSVLLKQSIHLDPIRTVNIASQICGSLSEAHAIGLIHRDLKPDNIIVTRTADGREFVRVVDFGIAKDTTNTDMPTEAGMVYGSPGYMSPEQILDQPLSARSDIYSLGAILYRMATGAKPFGNTNPIALLSRHIYSPPASFASVCPGVEIPGSLEWVTMTCLAKDPSSRFATSSEVARALKICELEARGLLPKPALSLAEGRLTLPSEVEDALARFGGDISVITPSPIAARSLSISPESTGSSVRSNSIRSEAEPEEPVSGTVSLSRRLSHPLVLLLGGLIPVAAGGILVVLSAIIAWLSVLAWRASQPPVAAVLPAIEAPAAGERAEQPPVEPEHPSDAEEGTADAPDPSGEATPVEGEPKDKGKTKRPQSARPKAPTTPAPVVPEPQVPAAPEPQVPVEKPDPSHRSDLRDPFED